MPRGPRAKAPADDGTLYRVTVSGKTYNQGLTDYPVQPVETKEKGYGVQHIYNITKTERQKMFDHLAVVASDVADELDDTHPIVLAIYKDMDRFF
jgi:hypothetical protein